MYSSLYQFIIKNLYPGKTVRQNLQEMEHTEWLSRSEIEDIQFKKTKKILNYAYDNIPFYRKLYQREDIHPNDINNFKDFQALPFITRGDIKTHRKDFIPTGYKGRVFEGRTSGSTDSPMEFVMDWPSVWSAFAFNARSRGWYGVQPGDKRAFVTALQAEYNHWPLKERLVSKVKRYRYLNVVTMTEPKMQKFAEMLLKWQPAMIRAYPSSLAVFAHYLKDHGITGIRPKLVEVTAEKATPAQRALFEEVFEAKVADHYASLEIYSYAYQCPDGGLHVNEERHLELVKDNKPVDPGQMGEVVVTALDQFAMPFIRYKNGDIAISGSNGCPCGRGIPILNEVVGRNFDLLVNPEGKVVHWSGFLVIMLQSKEVRQFQVYQPDRNNLEVRLVCKDNIDKSHQGNIRNRIQSLFGPSMNISIRLQDKIEMTESGKRRTIISKVKPDCI